MIRILQISDIHWKNKLERQDAFKIIREGMIADIKRGMSQEGMKFDCILICGDIAFSGDKEQYEKASKFIKELCELTHCKEDTDVFVVPGNHDKNWFSPPKAYREIINRHIIEEKDPEEALSEWLQKSLHTAEMMFTPYKDYEAFAYPYGCSEPLMHRFNQEGPISSTAQYDENQDLMYWEEELGKIKGYTIKLYGLNSTLYSDINDYDNSEKRKDGHKMLLSRLASCGAKLQDDVVNIMMMHHPTPYFVDGNSLKAELDRLYHVQFFGHVHIASSDNNNNRIHVFSGALQPEEMGSGSKDYNPVYNIVELDIVDGEQEDYLRMRLQERFWDGKTFKKLRVPQNFSVLLPKYTWGGTTMEKRTELPEGVSKREIRLKLINHGKAKEIINEIDSAFYDEGITPYYNIMRFLEKVRQENLWGELWSKMNS